MSSATVKTLKQVQLPDDVDPLVGPDVVTKALGGLSVRTLDRMIARKAFPAPDVRIGPNIRRWRASTLRRFTWGQDT